MQEQLANYKDMSLLQHRQFCMRTIIERPSTERNELNHNYHQRAVGINNDTVTPPFKKSSLFTCTVHYEVLE